MISELLQANGNLLIPLALLVAGIALVKGIFHLHRASSQTRKEFLELWRGGHPDDLWIEVATRHLFGRYLPASLIRSLRTSTQAGRAIGEISEAWPLLDMDDETGEVQWRWKWLGSPVARGWLRAGFGIAYFVLMAVALFLAYVFLMTSEPLAPYLWVYPFACALAAFWCLQQEDRMKVAGRAVPRWLGLP